ncbi:ubiquitin-like protein [Stipitochalara longipes BDJ]|nr:ubiquitin-like protein [Stipitochalara longipes BDJ]
MARSDGSASPGPEVEPKASGARRSTQLCIKIKNQQEVEVDFRIKSTTKFSKVFENYCSRQQIDRHSVRFFLDNTRIQDDDTAERLEMEDGDEIQCHLEQLGGDGTPAAEGEPKPEQLNVKVVDQDGNDLYFKIKKHTALKKVMDAYCERQGKTRGLVRFLFEGHRIQDNDTPESLELEDNDMIQVFLEQQGGDGSEPDDAVQKHINITVKDDANQETTFKLKKTTPLKKLMDAFAQQRGQAPDALRFYTPEGRRILPTDTPDSLELEEGDILDVHIQQLGGSHRL